MSAATEFDFIHYIKKSFGLRAIGDDCAVLPKNDQFDTVVSVDLMIEDIDFRLNWTSPKNLGHKALAISLSDIAAMGAQPVWSLLTLGVPDHLWNTSFLREFYQGWTELAGQFGVELAGGDISRSPERLVIDSFVGGEVEKGKAIMRSGAKSGDRIYVSGKLGGAAGGLRLMESYDDSGDGGSWKTRLIDRQLRPTPQVALGRRLLRDEIASAMIDLSDGLSSDLLHICEDSGVGAELNASAIPIDKDLVTLISEEEALTLALNGGEDFELLFTVPEEKAHLLTSDLVTCIGVITDAASGVQLKDGNQKTPIYPLGYRHF